MFAQMIAAQRAASKAKSRATQLRWDSLAGYLWLVLPLFAMPALLPLLIEGLPRSFDGGLHLLRTGLLDSHIRQGMLFPRWTPESLLGHGYPLFNYYAPGAYYLVEGLHLLGLSIYDAFVASFILLVNAAGVGMYGLALRVFGERHKAAALAAAVVYIYTPYLLTNVYIRGALSEVGAQALLPWVLWGAHCLLYAGRPARFAPWVALSLGGLTITHTITLLFAPPLLLGYIFLHWWRSGRSVQTPGWAVGALVGAMGVSAFYWLPLLCERNYVADTAFILARTLHIPGNVWTWDNFLDRGFAFDYTFDRPIRLGLVQLLLGASGLFLARRRDMEWLFWVAVAAITSVLMSKWALPFWLSSDTFIVAQFTWRLLAILAVPLALFTGGLVLPWRRGWCAGVALTGVLLAVMLAHSPRLQWMDVFARDEVDVSLPVYAQTEVDKGVLAGGEANSSIQEFRPRWADKTLILDASSEAWDGSVARVMLEAGNAYELVATVATTKTTALRFNSYYFPGWQVLLDGTQTLRTYPSTNLGLLTVDLPKGVHEVQLTWTGTPVQNLGALISQLALVLLGWHCWRTRSIRWMAGLPLVLLAFGLAATISRPALASIQAPAQPVEAHGLRLVGYRVEKTQHALYLYPYWHVSSIPDGGLRVHWQLLDGMDRSVHAESVSMPYFNSYPADNFAPGALVDDAYKLALPPGLPAGVYRLAVGFGETLTEAAREPVVIGGVTLPRNTPRQQQPSHFTHVRFGHTVRLAGYDFIKEEHKLLAAPRQPPVVDAGDYLYVRLYWRAMGLIDNNYHSFVHLVDSKRQPLVQQDQLPGPVFHPPLLWDPYYYQTDTHLLRIPDTAPSGLYWPAVGVYNFSTLERLTAYMGEGLDLGYDVRLPPVKIINRAIPTPDQPVYAQFGEIAQMTGYDLQLPGEGLRPGDTFTVTVHWVSDASTTVAYTRFVHLYDAERGMAAQFDSPPQDGANPTWAWAPGEVIADPVMLRVSPEAKPGLYTLYVGMYNPRAGGERLPVYGSDGELVIDQMVPLTDVVVHP